VVLGVVTGFNSMLVTLNSIGFLYNLAVSFVIFWSMHYLSRLRIVVVND